MKKRQGMVQAMNTSNRRILLNFLLWGILCGNLFVFRAAQGETIRVSSVPAMQSAISKASAGDIVELENGTYLNNTLTISKSNLTVKAATPGGVILNGTNDINITGNNVIFSGFQFITGNIGEAYVIEVSGSFNLLSELNFNGYSAKKYIHIQAESQYNEIRNCNIENKPVAAVVGCTIQISTSPTVIGYHRIRYCSFRNFPGPGGDYGNEPVRIGLSTEMTNISRTIVEHCFFENVGLGDGESISVKSSENLCRYNTFTNNPKGMLVFRHGYRNVAYGNFFMNGSGGIRIKEGSDHYVYNNYFSTGAADAVTLQYVAEFPLENIRFAHNTFVNCGDLDLGGTGPAKVSFENNIFLKNAGNIFSNANGGTTWSGNMIYGNSGIAISTGMTQADPKLILNPSGYYELSPSSPAINAASTIISPMLDIAHTDDDPKILLDFTGQNRPQSESMKDIGCDEYDPGPVNLKPLTLTEAGPVYLRGNPTSVCTDIRGDTGDLTIFPNPASTWFQLRFTPGSKSLAYLTVLDTEGRLVRKYSMGEIYPDGLFSRQFDISSLANGTYQVVLVSENRKRSIKLIILN